MTISKKSESSQKNQYINLAAITASLALGHVSDVGSNIVGYVSPNAAFVSAESCNYPVDYRIENGFREASNGSSR